MEDLVLIGAPAGPAGLVLRAVAVGDDDELGGVDELVAAARVAAEARQRDDRRGRSSCRRGWPGRRSSPRCGRRRPPGRRPSAPPSCSAGGAAARACAAGCSGSARPTRRPTPSRGSRRGTAAPWRARAAPRRAAAPGRRRAACGLNARMPSTCACQNLPSSVSVARTCSRRGRPKQSSGSRRARATSAPATSSSSTDGSPKRRTAQWSARLKAARCTSWRPSRGPGRVGDLPLHARLVLVVALEVVAVGDAVDAVDARGVEGLQPLGDLLELRAPGGGEARALDRRLRVREVRRPRLVARRALVGRPLLPLRGILELGRRLVEVRVAGVEHVAAVVEHLADGVLRVLERLLEEVADRRQRLVRIEARRRRGLLTADARPAAALAGLPARVLLLRRDALRVLLRDDPVARSCIFAIRASRLALLNGSASRDATASRSHRPLGAPDRSTVCAVLGARLVAALPVVLGSAQRLARGLDRTIGQSGGSSVMRDHRTGDCADAPRLRHRRSTAAG